MTLKEESKVALKVAHLSMVQGAITRMSGFSATAKTFTVTIFAGLVAISLQADQAQLGIIALASTIVLGTLDVYYMTLELRFRAFYDHVVARDLNDADNLAITPLKRPGDIRTALNSNAFKLFYVPVFLACVIFIVYGLVHDRRSQRLPRPVTPSVEQSAAAKLALAAKRVGRLVRPNPASTDGTVGQCASRQSAAIGAE